MAHPVPPDSPLNVPVDEIENLPAREDARTEHVREKVTAITLRGIALTDKGTVVKSKFFNILNQSIDDYSDIQFTLSEARKYKAMVMNYSTGSCASTPVLCTGEHCPWADRCPLYTMGKAPLGRQCLIELNIIKNAQLSYLNEYDVDPYNYTEWTMINELADIEVYLWRINQNLARNADLASGIVEQTTGVTPQGHEIKRKEISAFFELQDKLLNRKRRIVKMLVGDRQEKYKRQAALKTIDERDPSSSMALVRSKLEKLEREVDIVASNLAEPAEVVGSESEGKAEKALSTENSPLSPDDVIID